MLSFSLINETSPYYLEPSFLGKYLTHNQPDPDDVPPAEDNKYVRDELGDVRFNKDGEPLEKSDVGIRGFMKRLVGKPNYDQPQNDGGKIIETQASFSGNRKFPKLLNYNKRPPEEQLW